ncbi:MAG TPA: histidine kinase, partial [Acidobacteriota bacterium]|nr:histidine kinase [Acidobacteriota bacterium]
MPENQSPFSKHYHAALDRHLRQRASSLRPPRAARALGPKAFALGLDPLDLVQVHDRALNGLNLSGSRIPAPSSDGAPTQAGSFLLAALTSLAEVQHAHRQTAATAPRLVASLRARSSALTRVRRQLQREVARRKLAEQQLSLGTRHYNRLLAQSHQLQIQSRRLAHQVLTAQEEERKEISRELHDEVAQILAGINVQLAALKEASAIGSRGLRRRINQTQQLVQRSVKVVHRYARELRPALLDDLGLIPALRAYIRDLPGRKSLQISFTAFPGVEDLDNL